MRILVIAQYFPPRRSTFSSRWAWLITHLAERGHEVDVVALMSNTRQLGNLRHALEADPPPSGVTIHPVLPLGSGHGIVSRAVGESLVAGHALLRSFAVRDVDVVVASAPTIVTIPIGWLSARMRRRPFVLDLRDAWPELMGEWRTWSDDGQGARPLHPLKRLAFPVAAHVVGGHVEWFREHADAVVVTTEGLQKRLIERGLPRVHVVRNTSTKPWPYSLRPVPEESNELRVLYLGNVGRAQLIATAIRAAALASERGTRLTLRIVGSGPHWDAARKIARQTQAPVEFVDRVPTYEVLDHYRWADTVLIMLRDWDAMGDTVPSKLYEALLTGRHITASVTGETAELIARFSSGDVVPPEDVEALAELWAGLAVDRARLHVPHGGRRWVSERLTPEDLTREFESALRGVVRD